MIFLQLLHKHNIKTQSLPDISIDSNFNTKITSRQSHNENTTHTHTHTRKKNRNTY